MCLGEELNPRHNLERVNVCRLEKALILNVGPNELENIHLLQ